MSRLLTGPLLLLTLVWTMGTPAQQAEKFKLSKAEEELLELTNAERKKEGLPPLRASPALFQAARAHSENMAKQETMNHVLDGKTPFQRIKATGYLYYFAGENIAWSEDDRGAMVLKGWMNSPPHRKNILNPNFTEIGLGRATSANGKAYYFTQVFGKPRPR